MAKVQHQIAVLAKAATRKGKRDTKTGELTTPPMLVLQLEVPVEHLDSAQIAFLIQQADRDVYLSVTPIQAEMPLTAVQQRRAAIKDPVDFFEADDGAAPLVSSAAR